MPPDDLPEEFEIDQAPIWPEDDDRLEPIFLAGPPWFGVEEFEEPDPKREPDVPDVPLAEFEAVPQLDPERNETAPDEAPPTPRQRASATGLFGSLGMHLLPLVVLIGWSSAPAELAASIPVQFVVAEPPAGPDEAPDRLATEAISETPSRADNSPAAAAPEQPPPTKTAAATPRPPKPTPPSKPAPLQPVAVTRATPTPLPVATNPAATLPAATTPSAAPSPSRAPGPDPARSDYFDHLVALTRTHLDLLPRAFLAGRRGQTILSIVVLEDGAIGRISLKRSSGYPDIDARIEQIVAAVGRFPPLPASFDHPSVELDFDLTFPNALQQ